MQSKLRAAGIATLATTAVAAGVALAQEPQYDPNYEPPRTPWGDPDLQGTWPGTDYVGVPMTRSPELGERNWLNEEEYVEEVARRERQAPTGAPNSTPRKGILYSWANVAMPWVLESTRHKPLLYLHTGTSFPGQGKHQG